MWLGNRFNVWLSESQKRTKRDLNVLPLLSFSILNFCQTNPHHPSRCCIMLSISLCYSPVLKRESTGWLQKYLCSNWNNWPFSSKITVTVVPKKSFNMSYLGCSLHVHIWFWVLCSYSATICGYQAKREGKSLLFFKFIPLLWWDSFSVYHRLRWRKKESFLWLCIRPQGAGPSLSVLPWFDLTEISAKKTSGLLKGRMSVQLTKTAGCCWFFLFLLWLSIFQS